MDFGEVTGYLHAVYVSARSIVVVDGLGVATGTWSAESRLMA